MPDGVAARPKPRGGVLAPLMRPGMFRVIWAANLVSALGTLIQATGAAWLMTSLAGTPDLVALVQTAMLAPILLFSLVAGAFADIVDRRQVLIVAQVWTAASAACLALLGFLGLLGPAGLLLLTFALGIGTALNGPAWQAAVREIVPIQDLAAAVTLNAIAFNIARAVGPALGGILIAATGAETAFIVNAFSSLAMIAAMLVWRRDLPKEDLPRERLGSAMITGLRYVTETPPIRAVLVRGAAFGTLAAAIMALLPLIARDRLGGDATLYGFLLGAFGLGALIGAFMIHRVRQAKGAEFVITLLTAVFGTALLLLGLFPSLPTAAIALPLAGAAWLGSFSTFNISIQMVTAPWVQARVLALYQSTIFGGMALGSWVWGHLAAYTGLDMAQVIVGALLLATLLLHFRYPMPAAEAVDLRPMASRGTDPKPAVPFRYEEGPGAGHDRVPRPRVQHRRLHGRHGGRRPHAQTRRRLALEPLRGHRRRPPLDRDLHPGQLVRLSPPAPPRHGGRRGDHHAGAGAGGPGVHPGGAAADPPGDGAGGLTRQVWRPAYGAHGPNV